ncbi:MAG: hypothetical protein RJA25_731 [Bacteroidota bacterium]|jgi:hypothetical protein
MRLILAILISMSFKSFGFSFQSSKGMENFIQKSNAVPCVQAYLNTKPLNFGSFISKKSKGIITVSNNKSKNIYFNITLKSNIGKKDEPPVYLRFIKQRSLDITEILEYAGEGDEIYIEEFVPSVNKINLNCIPVSFTVIENS